MMPVTTAEAKRECDVVSSPLSRVRSHLRLVTGTQTSPPRDLVNDICTLVGRLTRLNRLGGDFQNIELSPHLKEAVQTVKLIGNEMLVLKPGRRGA